MLCNLDNSELNIAAELYARVYNVNVGAASAVVENFANIVLAQKDNTVINAILCAAKFNIGNNTVVLLHGAACNDYTSCQESTDSQSSNMPVVINALMQYAKSTIKADNFIFVQANEALCECQNIDNQLGVRVLARDIKRNLWAKAEFDTITARKLCQYREKYISEKYPQLSLEQTAALLTCLYSQGITSAETSKAYALYFRTADSLRVVELYAQSDVDAWFLLEAMADHEGRSKAQLILSENNTIFAGEGKRVNYASYTNAQIENNNIYIGPMPK